MVYKIKCPRCDNQLSKVEIDNLLCHNCGCLFSIDKSKNNKTKMYSGIINDTRKMNYRFWIKFYIFFLILWAIITIYGIVQGFFTVPHPWNWVILVIGVVVYAIVFTLVQFKINLARDVYILKTKMHELEHSNNRQEEQTKDNE